MTQPTPPAQPTETGSPGAPTQQDPPPTQTAGATYDQATVERMIAERLTRERRQFADEAKELKAKAAEADRLKKERETETEKAIREAEERGRNAALAEAAPRLVLAEMRAAAAGRIEPSRLDDLVDDIDLKRYLTESGSVDLERVRRKVDAWSPPVAQPDPSEQTPPAPQQRRPRPDPTQGTGRPPATGGGERGLAEARKRFGDRAVGPAARQ